MHSDTASDGTGEVAISGGTLSIEDCGGDGIQGECVTISDGTIRIATVYENAPTRYYAIISNSTEYPNYIVHSSSGPSDKASVKTEKVTFDTGSHTGIKAGTGAKTFTYEAVEEGSLYTAGQAYVQSASGSLEITGGTVWIDTTATGIKYNSSNDTQTIIGAPADGIHCGNTAKISGGAVTIHASDDGISAPERLTIDGSAVVDIQTAFEGLEGSQIVIGSENAAGGTDDTESTADAMDGTDDTESTADAMDGTDDTEGAADANGPSVAIYSHDDGINASGKTVVCTYADEEEAQYTK
jgi:hypothetical protein